MEIIQLLENYISSVIITCGFYYISYKLVKSKQKIFDWKTVLLILIIALGVTLNYIYFNNFMKVIVNYFLMSALCKIKFKKEIATAAVDSFIAYLLILLSEIIYTAILLILIQQGVFTEIIQLTGNISNNIIISLIAVLIFRIFKKFLQSLIEKIENKNNIPLIIIASIILIGLSSAFYKTSINGWKLDMNFILNCMLILTIITIGITIIYQKNRSSYLSYEYKKLMQYSKQTEELLEDYRVNNHENKNQLIVIKSLVNKDNIELKDYLNEVIQEQQANTTNNIINELKYIPFGGLKGFLYHKLQDIKEHNIKIEISISKEIEESSLGRLTAKENLELCKIVGVCIDNAKEASNLTEDKKIMIDVYKDNENQSTILIVNSYKGEINLEEIGTSGKTTKGIGRGHGLALVKKITDQSEIFKVKRETQNNLFKSYVYITKIERRNDKRKIKDE